MAEEVDYTISEHEMEQLASMPPPSQADAFPLVDLGEDTLPVLMAWVDSFETCLFGPICLITALPTSYSRTVHQHAVEMSALALRLHRERQRYQFLTCLSRHMYAITTLLAGMPTPRRAQQWILRMEARVASLAYLLHHVRPGDDFGSLGVFAPSHFVSQSAYLPHLKTFQDLWWSPL
ncbi:hypothetical protein H257_02855 [Aphanomyces astaci]|uniref:Uncharacterized protein n=1 Tax=Aphanomyces astaci TaxID=112090 RepID=W4GYZ6_APHAT|nr:hypothetical protein H257_02855 [Aphanomyces astaci]ETV84960.1 hypothetical protein H257_02855 [Aphanomyces astaci]|eukprot:XP_009824978.1 hypothetical protein H257_02855 [Aphanomyces astaci]